MARTACIPIANQYHQYAYPAKSPNASIKLNSGGISMKHMLINIGIWNMKLPCKQR